MDDPHDRRRADGLLRIVVRYMAGPTAAGVAAVAIASAGFVVVEDWHWFDAVYMALITIGTVGFGEVNPLSDAGRVWTMAVIVAGFSVFVYTSASLTALFLSGEVAASIRERRRARMRDQLSDHVVVIGFGRVGRAAAEAAVRSGRQCVVIDTDDHADDAASAVGATFLRGDARDVTVLRDAGVARAAALITSLDDPSNAVVALTARSLSPILRIVARVTDVAWRERLMRAGASHVVPVYESIGASLTATALDAEVVGVLPVPGTDMRIEEVEVGVGSTAEGSDLRSLGVEADDVHILGIRRDARLRRWPEADEPLLAGDMLVVLGTATGLDRLTALVRHGSRGG